MVRPRDLAAWPWMGGPALWGVQGTPLQQEAPGCVQGTLTVPGPQERVALPSPSVVSEQSHPPFPVVPGPGPPCEMWPPRQLGEHSLPRKSPERTCWPQRPLLHTQP